MPVGVAAAPARSRRRAPDVDVAVKLRVSHLVEGADLEPGEVPPAAILIVRRVADPLPLGLSIGERAAGTSPAWERAARSTLGEIARAAVRPAQGAVPSNANAVLFADQAELLAYFSRDYLRNEAAFLWWWRAMLRSFPGTGSRALFEVWRQNIRYVPAVVTQLAEIGQMAFVLGSFTPDQSTTILREVARAFDLHDVLAVTERALGRRETDISRPGGLMRLASSIEDTGPYTQARDVPIADPWRESGRVETLTAGLSREHAALAEVSLELCQSPGIVRKRSFAAALEHRWRSAPSVFEGESEPAERPGAVLAAVEANKVNGDIGRQSAGLFTDSASSRMSPSGADLADGSAYGVQTEAHSPSTTSNEMAAEQGKDVRVEGTIAGDKELSEKKLSALSPGRETESRKLSEVAEGAQEPDVKAAASLLGSLEPFGREPGTAFSSEEHTHRHDLPAILRAGNCVLTELGGVFFLVKLIEALRIPELLEKECNCDLGLSGWECLELITRCLLGASRPDLASDPVWRLLSIVDGRSPEQGPGEAFCPATSYCLPKAWLLNEEMSTAAVRVCGERFEVWSLLGFPVSTSCFEGTLTARAIKYWCEGYALRPFSRVPRLWSGAHALGISLERHLQNFLAFLMPFVRWRLAASLGFKDKTRLDFTKLLLLRRGKIWVTATHVDVVIPLKEATSAVRLAGLDVDPGWIPNLGRVIKFYFQ